MSIPIPFSLYFILYTLLYPPSFLPYSFLSFSLILITLFFLSRSPLLCSLYFPIFSFVFSFFFLFLASLSLSFFLSLSFSFFLYHTFFSLFPKFLFLFNSPFFFSSYLPSTSLIPYSLFHFLLSSLSLFQIYFSLSSLSSSLFTFLFPSYYIYIYIYTYISCSFLYLSLPILFSLPHNSFFSLIFYLLKYLSSPFTKNPSHLSRFYSPSLRGKMCCFETWRQNLSLSLFVAFSPKFNNKNQWLVGVLFMIIFFCFHF